jgi:hypothetical protein
VSAAYDWTYFILSPVIGLAIVIGLGLWPWATQQPQTLFGISDSPVEFFIAIWTYAHLTAVVFRSHANPEIFALHRFRFVGVPILLFAGLMVSDWVLIVGFALGQVWDNYHSGLQNFGFGRIYDARRGNDARTGRWLDIGLAHVLYSGPIVGGLSLLPNLSSFRDFSTLGWQAPNDFLNWLPTVEMEIRLGMVILGGSYIAFYCLRYWQLSRSGYHVSPLKVWLMACVGIASVVGWGFLPPGPAFFVANFYHAVQYFAIVWALERKNITRVFGMRSLSGNWIVPVAYMVSVIGAGCLYRFLAVDTDVRWLLAAGLIVSLMHFWYDGFIWSVRRSQV